MMGDKNSAAVDAICDAVPVESVAGGWVVVWFEEDGAQGTQKSSTRHKHWADARAPALGRPAKPLWDVPLFNNCLHP